MYLMCRRACDEDNVSQNHDRGETQDEDVTRGLNKERKVTDQRTKPWQDAHVENGKCIAQNGAWCIEADWETYNMEGGGREVWHVWKMDVLCRNSAYEVISWCVSSAPEYHDLPAALKSPSAPSDLKKLKKSAPVPFE